MTGGSWPGTPREYRALKRAVGRHCQCFVDGGRRMEDLCASHDLLLGSPDNLARLVLARRQSSRLRDGEFHLSPPRDHEQ